MTNRGEIANEFFGCRVGQLLFDWALADRFTLHRQLKLPVQLFHPTRFDRQQLEDVNLILRLFK